MYAKINFWLTEKALRLRSAFVDFKTGAGVLDFGYILRSLIAFSKSTK